MFIHEYLHFFLSSPGPENKDRSFVNMFSLTAWLVALKLLEVTEFNQEQCVEVSVVKVQLQERERSLYMQ